MKPSSLKLHFSSCHLELANDGTAYFKQLEVGVKRARLDQSGHVSQQNQAGLQASYGGFENCSTEETTQHWREAHPSMLQRSVHNWGWC